MAKKKEIKHIFVKNPKIGSKYYFYFAGGWDYGTLINRDEKLTNHYNHDWFTFESPNHDGRIIKYPTSIYDIRKDVKDTKK